MEIPERTFLHELEMLINRHCEDDRTNTPDYILAGYMHDCLFAWKRGIAARDSWFGFKPFGREQSPAAAPEVE